MQEYCKARGSNNSACVYETVLPDFFSAYSMFEKHRFVRFHSKLRGTQLGRFIALQKWNKNFYFLTGENYRVCKYFYYRGESHFWSAEVMNSTINRMNAHRVCKIRANKCFTVIKFLFRIYEIIKVILVLITLWCTKSGHVFQRLVADSGTNLHFRISDRSGRWSKIRWCLSRKLIEVKNLEGQEWIIKN